MQTWASGLAASPSQTAGWIARKQELPSPVGATLPRGTSHMASAATQPRQGTDCSLVSLAVPEGLFIKNLITTRQLWRLTFQPQTPSGNGRSRHFKEQDMLAFLAVLKAYRVMKMHSGASMVAQTLRRHTPNARGPGSIPGQGTRSHMPQLRLGAAKQILKKKNAFNCTQMGSPFPMPPQAKVRNLVLVTRNVFPWWAHHTYSPGRLLHRAGGRQVLLYFFFFFTISHPHTHSHVVCPTTQAGHSTLISPLSQTQGLLEASVVTEELRTGESAQASRTPLQSPERDLSSTPKSKLPGLLRVTHEAPQQS